MSASLYQQVLTQSYPENGPHINEMKFEEICGKLEIRQTFKDALRDLVHYKVIVICDDSGSMGTLVDGGPQTRWTELLGFMKLIFEMSQFVEDSGIDIHFLNRLNSIIDVKNLSQIEHAFVKGPSGGTPIVNTLKRVLNETPIWSTRYRGRIVLVITDGEPTDKDGCSDKRALFELLQNRIETDYFTFLACTDDKEVVGYLNEWDDIFKRFDVVDDYETEKKQVLDAQVVNEFTRGDYAVKVMLGSVNEFLDKLDQNPNERRTRRSEDKGSQRQEFTENTKQYEQNTYYSCNLF
jgi:hypothetical protein